MITNMRTIKKLSMQLAIICMMLSFISLVNATPYEEGINALANGDVVLAREKLSLVSSSDEYYNEASGILDFLKRMGNKNTLPLITEDSTWNFIGEVNDDGVVTHLFYNANGNSISHSRFSGEIDPEFLSETGVEFTQKEVLTGINGYEASIKSEDLSIVTKIWYCTGENMTSILTYTYSGEDQLSSSELNPCGSAAIDLFSYWKYMLVGVIFLVVIGVIVFVVITKKKK